MKTVDEVKLIAGQELINAPGTPDGTWGMFLFPPTGLFGYKRPISDIGNIIASELGTAINRPDRVYFVTDDGSGNPEILTPADVTILMDTNPLSPTFGYPIGVEDPYLDGLEYSNHLRGVEYLVKGSEWQNDVEGGGWRFTDGRFLEIEQIITISFKPQISPVISTPDAVARFLDQSGIQLVTATSTLSVGAQRKLIYIQGATAVVTVTLDATYPEGVLCALLTANGTQIQTTIQAPVGQTIILNGSKTYFVLGQAEYAYLVRYGTTWYVISVSDGWMRVGQLIYGGLPGANVIAANRQVLQEAEVPRLATHLTALEAALPGSVVSAAQQAANPTRWARGGGQIWVPRPAGYFIRALDLGANVDPDRTTQEKNQAGSVQGMQIQQHGHSYDQPSLFPNPDGGGVADKITTVTGTTGLTGGNETRPINAAYPVLIYI